MTFCQLFEVASRVRQKVVDHRSLTIEKCSVQEKKIVGDKRSLITGSLMTGSTVLLRFSINEYLLFLHAYFTHIRMLSGALCQGNERYKFM